MQNVRDQVADVAYQIDAATKVRPGDAGRRTLLTRFEGQGPQEISRWDRAREGVWRSFEVGLTLIRIKKAWASQAPEFAF